MSGILECSLCEYVFPIEWVNGCEVGCDHCPSCGSYAGLKDVPTVEKGEEY